MSNFAMGTTPTTAVMGFIKSLVGDVPVVECIINIDPEYCRITVKFYIEDASAIATKDFKFSMDEHFAKELVNLLGEHIESLSYTVKPNEFDTLNEIKYCPKDKSDKFFSILQNKVDEEGVE